MTWRTSTSRWFGQ